MIHVALHWCLHLKEQTSLPIFIYFLFSSNIYGLVSSGKDFSCQVLRLMVLSLGLQLNGVGSGSHGCYWSAVGSVVGRLVTRSLGEFVFCLVPQ